MKWIDNYIEFKRNNTCGVCPKCGSDNIDVQELQCGIRSSVTFLCEKCGSSAHFDEATTKSDENYGNLNKHNKKR